MTKNILIKRSAGIADATTFLRGDGRWAVPPGGVGGFSGDAALITSGTIAIGRLGTGTPDSTKYLRGDNVWATLPIGDIITYADLASRPTAAVFNAGHCLISNINYIIASVSDGVEWYSRGKSTLLANRPSAVTFGKGTWQIDGTYYLSDGANWLQVLVTDVNGDVFANLVPRINTLSNLLTTVGTQGELGSASDQSAIVKFRGAASAGGSIFRAERGGESLTLNSVFNSLNASVALTSHSFVASHNMNPLPGSLLGGIAVIANAGATSIQGTFDFINWFKIDPRTGAATPKLCVSGDTIYQTEIANIAYTLRPPYTTWTATAALHATITTWSAPIPLESHNAYTSCFVYDNSGTSGNCAFITANPTPVVNATTLPNGDIFTTGSVVADIKQAYDGKTNKNLGFIIVLAGTNKYYLGGAYINIGTTAYTLPAVVTTPVVVGMDDGLVIYDKANNTFYINRTIKPYIGATGFGMESGDAGSPTFTATDQTAWETYPGPGKLTVNTGTFIGNRRLACVFSNAGVFVSSDLVVWKAMPTTGLVPATAAAIPAGILFTKLAEEYTALYANDGTLYTLNAPIAITNFGTTALTYGNKLFTFGTTATNAVYSLDPIIERKLLSASLATVTTQNITAVTGMQECTAPASAAMTINLPPCPWPGREVTVKVNNIHTTLTFGTQATPLNQTIRGAATWSPGTNTAGQIFKFTYWASGDWSVVAL